MSAQVVRIPINKFKGEDWLLLSPVLGKRVEIMAHEMDKVRLIKDFDGHTACTTSARGSVKCRAKTISISDKILTE